MERRDSSLFVTIRQASRLTGIGQRQLRRAITAGELEVFDVGAWPRLSWSTVLDWLHSKKRAPQERGPS